MTPLTRSRCTPSLWSVIQEPGPARDPRLDAEDVEVATGEIRRGSIDGKHASDPAMECGLTTGARLILRG
jgi:hypothetical protein